MSSCWTAGSKSPPVKIEKSLLEIIVAMLELLICEPSPGISAKDVAFKVGQSTFMRSAPSCALIPRSAVTTSTDGNAEWTMMASIAGSAFGLSHSCPTFRCAIAPGKPAT